MTNIETTVKFNKKKAEVQLQKYAGQVTSTDDINDILSKEDAILSKAHGPLAKLVQDIKLLFAVIKDYAKGNYKEIPFTTIAGIVGALIMYLRH